MMDADLCVILRLRPRWKRVLLSPMLVCRYRALGVPFVAALRLAWGMVTL